MPINAMFSFHLAEPSGDVSNTRLDHRQEELQEMNRVRLQEKPVQANQGQDDFPLSFGLTQYKKGFRVRLKIGSNHANLVKFLKN